MEAANLNRGSNRMYQHRQIHVWITESDYQMLRELSVESRESVSAIIRKLVKNERQRVQDIQPDPVEQPTEMYRTYAS